MRQTGSTTSPSDTGYTRMPRYTRCITPVARSSNLTRHWLRVPADLDLDSSTCNHQEPPPSPRAQDQEMRDVPFAERSGSTISPRCNHQDTHGHAPYYYIYYHIYSCMSICHVPSYNVSFVLAIHVTLTSLPSSTRMLFIVCFWPARHTSHLTGLAVRQAHIYICCFLQ